MLVTFFPNGISSPAPHYRLVFCTNICITLINVSWVICQYNRIRYFRNLKRPSEKINNKISSLTFSKVIMCYVDLRGLSQGFTILSEVQLFRTLTPQTQQKSISASLNILLIYSSLQLVSLFYTYLLTRTCWISSLRHLTWYITMSWKMSFLFSNLFILS